MVDKDVLLEVQEKAEASLVLATNHEQQWYQPEET